MGVESWRVEAARADAADAEIRRAAKRPAPPAPEPKKAPIARHDSDLAAEFLPDDEHAADFSPALDGESGVMPVSARRAGATGRDRRIPKTKEPVTPELAALLASIEQMPLDQAMVVLATLTEPERDQLFARLNLNSSVRRRVERELEDLRRGAAEPTT